MPQMPDIYIDCASEAYDLIRPMAAGDFWQFENEHIQPGSIYVLGRMEMARCVQKVRSIIEQDLARIVFINAAEGSETMLGQLNSVGIKDLAEKRQIKILSGGPVGSHFDCLEIEYFLLRMNGFDENHAAQAHTDEIYQKTVKPYRFLFLNGRLRHHRKWLLERLRLDGLLERSIYSCLQINNTNPRGLTLQHHGQDLMQRLEPIKLLPPEYEHENYSRNLTVPDDLTFVKHHLFDNEWGEVYINPRPYVDSYFSLVTETVFDSPYSFRTEKIWKPIMMGHPWIAVANPGFYKDLRHMGFATMSGIIDESFDEIYESQARIERIAQVVRDLCYNDPKAFLRAAEAPCKANQQRFQEVYENCVRAFPQQFIDFVRS